MKCDQHDPPECTVVPAVEPRRRHFVQLAALGAGAALLGLSRTARAAGGTDVLLLSCMDFRLMDEVERYMTQRGLRNKYDHVVLAGASLGAVTDKFPAWNQTFWQHLDIAIKLHNIHTVMVLDHRDCGAYKVLLGPEHAKDKATETASHTKQLGILRALLTARHPTLKVETLLMALDGKVEPIA